MIDFFKQRYKKLRVDTKQFAVKYNVSSMEKLAFIHGIMNIFIVSSILSVYSIFGLASLPIPPYGIFYDAMWISANFILPVYIILILFTFGKYFVYPHLLFYHYSTKFFMWIFTTLDRYYWRKYRKQSPLTEFMYKSQSKYLSWWEKLSVQRKRLIKLGLFLGVAILVLSTRWNVIMGLF